MSWCLILGCTPPSPINSWDRLQHPPAWEQRSTGGKKIVPRLPHKDMLELGCLSCLVFLSVKCDE